MEPIVIDSICMTANGYTSTALEEIAGKRRTEDRAELDALEKLLAPLCLDYDTSGKIMEEFMNISAASEESGFRRGFRIAARLMVESLGPQKCPETGGGA